MQNSRKRERDRKTERERERERERETDRQTENGEIAAAKEGAVSGVNCTRVTIFRIKT